MTHPLANLPRPLDERDRGRRRARRALTLGIAAGALGAGVFTAVTLGGSEMFGMLGPVGGVAGAVATPDAQTVAELAPTPAPTATPTPAAPAVRVPPVIPTPVPTAVLLPDPTPAPPVMLTGYRWPLPRGRITLPFGPSPWGSRIVDGEKFHDGLDLATFCGDRIVAAHDGVVLAAGRRYDDWMGWLGDLTRYTDRLDAKKLWSTLPIVVVIDDGNGYRSIYAHFSKVVVKRGDTVKAGQFLGYEGMTGRASGCHLHFGLFSPFETAAFGIDPDVVKRMKVPKSQIARIDPLLVLPPRSKATPTPLPTPPP